MKHLECGFKNYDELVFGNNQTDISPFSEETWDLIISWYWKIAGILGGPILIATIILAWKMIIAGVSPDKRSEVKDNLMRMFFGAGCIGLAPIFVKLMLLINNSLVKLLVANNKGSLDDLLGNSLLSNINTGNAIATAIVIAMFAYLFVKINIKFIIRQFTIIVFTIFTPIVAVFWIINKRTIASSIWFGQIIINAFMQFIYAFLFLIYMNFLPESSGWAISLLWAMMILPLADALQNTMQNLVSRIAGIDNDAIANRGIGMGAAIGYTIKSIAYQFKSSSQTQENNSNPITQRPIIKQVTEMPAVNYENHSVNIMKNELTNQSKENATSTSSKKAYNVGKEMMNLGMYMAEGKNFRTANIQERKYNIPNTNQKDIEENTSKIISMEVDDYDE